jgi:uncharacterized protein YecE (DUF72 family)
MRGRLLIGTSGFAYPEWKGVLYPPDLRSDAMLRHYATEFPSLEINYTYRRDPSEKMLTKWAADTPEDFTFALKAHRRIVDRWRKDPAEREPLDRFLEMIAPLGPRVGPVLIQGPHNLKFAEGMLEAFLPLLGDGRRFAFDFRHAAWRNDAVKAAVVSAGAAWCIADTDDSDAPFEITAAGFAYVRLRKAAYEDEALERWAEDFRGAMGDGVDVYCYLKHADGDGGRGVAYARRLRELVTV